MTRDLAWSALGLFIAGALFICVLVLRRLRLAREEGVRRQLEPELRPLAFALIDGEAGELPHLDERSAEVLASILSRYAHQLSGGAHENIRAFFEGSGHVFRALAGLADRRTWRRAAAAYTLGDMGSPVAIAPLLERLRDPALDVRTAAARSLGVLDAEDAVEPLVRALVAGTVPRAIAAQALLSIGQAALPRLRELASDDDAGVRTRAIELVGLLGSAGDASLLVARLRDPSAEVRAKAARALGRLGAEEAGTELRAALRDRIPYVRATAAIALGQIGGVDAVDDLLAQARSDRFEPAQAAARAAASLDPERVRTAATEPGAGAHLREAADLAALRA